MFSKTVMKKMVQELSPQTLITLAHETLNAATGDEVNEAMIEAVSNVEMFMSELKRRDPQGQTPPRRKAAEAQGSEA